MADSLFHSDCYLDVVQPEGMTPNQYIISDDFDKPSEYSAKMRVSILRFKLSCRLDDNKWRIVTDATADELKINPELFKALVADLEEDNRYVLKILSDGTMDREDLLALRAKTVGDFGRQHAIKYYTYYHRPFTL